MPLRTGYRTLALQALLITAAAVLPLRPWATGAAIVLPLRPSTDGHTLRWILPAGARLLARGPYPGSLLIYGSRPRLFWEGLSRGALVIAAIAPICSPNGVRS